MNEVKEFYKKRQELPSFSLRKFVLMEKVRKFLKPTDKVLDLGCGDGLITAGLSMSCKIKGLDLNADILKKRFPWIEFSETDILMEQFNICDVVLVLDVLEHIPFTRETEILLRVKDAAKRLVIFNIPKHQDSTQIVERDVNYIDIIRYYDELDVTLVYFTEYNIGKETYNFMVFKK